MYLCFLYYNEVYKDLIPNKYKEFLDLLRKMLTIDPKQRINC